MVKTVTFSVGTKYEDSMETETFTFGYKTTQVYRTISPSGALSVVGHITSTLAGTAVGLPMDVGVSNDGRHFYTLNGNQGIVSVFNIQDDGSLVRLQVAAWTNFPYLGSQGLAVL